ncbi:DUF421 domain-containing protein [Bdellovibrio reynosensis]|uniref:DUF421 domain-containing protein n=1 Tax=Bdellovibrio reynosensis TaxID=2835041 RepID=A0ABY4C5I6_9BACT|nr:YetF domain-containing protein [Bdellovibrio reynosensis]UOE99743.1 DUF421 domain-containing protein [Bdellovibrio reynosensis]
MGDMTLPWWEFVLRAWAVYFFLVVILRVLGRRQIGEFSPFDLIVLLLLSDAVQNSLIGGDESLAGGLIVVTTLLLTEYGIGWLTFKFKPVSSIIEGEPKRLIENGVINEKLRKDEHLSDNDLKEALRAKGVANPKEVLLAMIETNGHITVIKKDEKFKDSPPKFYRTKKPRRAASPPQAEKS